MKKEKVLQTIMDVGLVAVVRAESADVAIRTAEACMEGGVAALEIAFTTPGTPKVLETLAARFNKGEILLGAGTVLDPETARIAILSGAQYLISPSLNPETARLSNRYRVPYMPGASTIRDIVEALELGVDVIKLFPGELAGPIAIKAIHGPLPQAQIMPTGGVDAGNVGEWIRAGAVAVGVGGALVGGAKTGDWASITATAKLLLARIGEARSANKA